jgi:hypothetical protein
VGRRGNAGLDDLLALLQDGWNTRYEAFTRADLIYKSVGIAALDEGRETLTAG